MSSYIRSKMSPFWKKLLEVKPELIDSTVYFSPTIGSDLKCIIRTDGTISPASAPEMRYDSVYALALAWRKDEIPTANDSKLPDSVKIYKVSFANDFFFEPGRQGYVACELMSDTDRSIILAVENLSKSTGNGEIAGSVSANSSEAAMATSAGNPPASSQKRCPGFPLLPVWTVIKSRQWHTERSAFSPVRIENKRCWSRSCENLISKHRTLCSNCIRARVRLRNERELLKQERDEERRLQSKPNRWLTLKEKLQKAGVIKDPAPRVKKPSEPTFCEKIVQQRPELFGRRVWLHLSPEKQLECQINDDGSISLSCSPEHKFTTAKDLLGAISDGRIQIGGDFVLPPRVWLLRVDFTRNLCLSDDGSGLINVYLKKPQIPIPEPQEPMAEPEAGIPEEPAIENESDFLKWIVTFVPDVIGCTIYFSGTSNKDLPCFLHDDATVSPTTAPEKRFRSGSDLALAWKNGDVRTELGEKLFKGADVSTFSFLDKLFLFTLRRRPLKDAVASGNKDWLMDLIRRTDGKSTSAATDPGQSGTVPAVTEKSLSKSESEESVGFFPSAERLQQLQEAGVGRVHVCQWLKTGNDVCGFPTASISELLMHVRWVHLERVLAINRRLPESEREYYCGWKYCAHCDPIKILYKFNRHVAAHLGI